MIIRCFATILLWVFSAYSASESYVFPAPQGAESPLLMLKDDKSLGVVQRRNIEVLILDTYQALNRKNTDSPLNVLNRSYNAPLPAWLHDAIERCEAWFFQTEGNISCRNGALYNYWSEYGEGKHDLSRREVRRLARVARIADVDFIGGKTIVFSPPIQWDLSEFASALVIDRIADYLRSEGIQDYRLEVGDLNSFGSSNGQTWNSVKDKEHVALANGAVSYLRPWQRPLLSSTSFEFQEKGVLSHSDGWPSAKFEVITVAPSSFDAALLSYFGAVKPAQQTLDLVNAASDISVKLTDETGRVFTSRDYLSRTSISSDSESSPDEVSITITLPTFDIADYRGPYVSVWISDDKNRLVKSLALRGTSERWLGELRTWWRRIGRKQEDIVDGFAGATKKNMPLNIIWDGLDEYGEPVTTTSLILHVEAAREHGGRTYQKVPFTLNATETSIRLENDQELTSITLAAMPVNR